MTSEKRLLIKIVIKFLLFVSIIFTSISSYANESTQEVGAASAWSNCTAIGPNGSCNVNTDALVTVKYGVEGKSLYYVASGISSGLPCNDFLGDPVFGTQKGCWFTKENILQVPTTGYGLCSTEGEACISKYANPRWVRYGVGNRWFYSIIGGLTQSGSPVKRMCTNAEFGSGFDPAFGQHKVCQIGPIATFANIEKGFTDCATDGGICSTGTTEAVLARYGATQSGVSAYTYRVIRNGKIGCNASNTGFNQDPWPLVRKTCSIKPLYYPVNDTVGRWVAKVRCGGPQCSTSYDMTYGTTHTGTTATTEEWGVTVTASIEKSFKVGAKVSSSVAVSYARSSTFQDAVTHSADQTISVTCDKQGVENHRWLYQFETNTVTSCLQSGHCTGKTLTQDYWCAINPPADYKGPQCLLHLCADELCTKCRDGS